VSGVAGRSGQQHTIQVRMHIKHDQAPS
jgi:hypothetical protein